METDHRYVIFLTHFVDDKPTQQKCFYIDKDDFDFYFDSQETHLVFCLTAKAD